MEYLINISHKLKVINLLLLIFAGTIPALAIANADNYSLEHKVAIINAGHLVPADDISVNRIRYLLGSLETSTGYSRDKIADQVVAARNLIREQFGKEVRILELLEAANKAEAVRTRTVKLEEYLALYATLAGR
jgi:hypothetical protein